MNYNGSQIGVPYTRVSRLTIEYPDIGIPSVLIEQAEAVKLADNTIREIQNLGSFKCDLDFTKGDDPIPLVSPVDGSLLGIDTTLNKVFVGVLAIIRQEQLKNELK